MLRQYDAEYICPGCKLSMLLHKRVDGYSVRLFVEPTQVALDFVTSLRKAKIRAEEIFSAIVPAFVETEASLAKRKTRKKKK
jgi:hypothetical protein